MSMAAAAGEQRRIIGTLVLHEAQTRFGRTQLGYVWALIEPMLHVGLMSLVYWAINRRAPVGESVVLFFVTGVLPYFLFQKTALHLGNALRSNRQLMRLPLVNAMDLIIARAILEAVTWTAVACLIFGTVILAGRGSLPDSPATCLAAALATFGLGFGVGLINAVLMARWKSWVSIYANATRPLYHFSAIFFFLEYIPYYLQEWLSWNPLIHAVQWFRLGYRADYATSMLDVQYLMYWVVGSITLGLCLERVMQTRVTSA